MNRKAMLELRVALSRHAYSNMRSRRQEPGVSFSHWWMEAGAAPGPWDSRPKARFNVDIGGPGNYTMCCDAVIEVDDTKRIGGRMEWTAGGQGRFFGQALVRGPFFAEEDGSSFFKTFDSAQGAVIWTLGLLDRCMAAARARR